MRTVLITGGCGFIGRYLAQELLDNGYKVRVLDALIDQVHADAAVALSLVLVAVAVLVIGLARGRAT